MKNEPATLIDALLAEQSSVGAAQRFSLWHEEWAPRSPQRTYRDLIPIRPPGDHEQLAFEVDLDRCSGCKGCVTACHSLNGLEFGETWRSVGLLTSVEAGEDHLWPSANHRFVQQTVTTACHHCLEPGCLSGCPVLAYDKDPHTGIVHHLDDQCIGCSYCTLTCPYEVPQFSKALGIVRKCDMCHGRLEEGEAPACVQGCPNEAIRIVHQDVRQVRIALDVASQPNPWLPDTPDPRITLPTTRYLTRRTGLPLHAADHHETRVAKSHWPLVFMLVLTQAGIGTLCLSWLLDAASRRDPFLLGTCLFCLGMAASVFHLGQPLKAWRIGLGWRTSWLSREAMALGLFACLAAGGLAMQVATPRWNSPLAWSVALCLSGVLSLFAQTMVYAATGRRSWRMVPTFAKFVLTAFLLGALLLLVFPAGQALTSAALLAFTAKATVELAPLISARSAHSISNPTSYRAAQLIQGPLRNAFIARWILGSLGGLILPVLQGASHTPVPSLIPALGFILALAGELLERRLFFAASAPDKMPGSIAP
ncbi:MAG: molybdopterin oxidoreductase [Verrucomicrobia bacterium]|nr:molybdopterin oxidoreductase [Verrucomicrobiota bacterium]